MLSAKYRFHSRGGVRYTYQKGKTLRTPELSLVFNPNDRGYTRFAVVVSKKVAKSAVLRNRIRRRLYEAIRLNPTSFSRPQDNIFVVYSKSLATLPFDELCRRLASLLEESYHS
ncbi:ribonuclease P protein component [Candidatus Saccharibacteria bacterium]|nr:ribonuclease P protein component [Candidatus Saccharibacteria bacterium]